MRASFHKLQWQASLVPITLILLLTAALGAYGLSGRTYWYDEWYSIYDAGGIYSAQFSPEQTFIKVSEQDPFHPPGYFIALGLWGGMVGWSEVATRSLSFFAGILAVAAIYRAGIELMSRKAGLYAALALGLSAFFLAYLREVRMYSLVPLLCALCIWFYARLLRRPPTRVGLVALFFTLVAMLYTHYVAGILALSIGLYHLIAAPKNRAWAIILFTIGAAGLTFLPWLGIAYSAALVAGADPTRLVVTLKPLEMTGDLLYLFSNGSVALLAVLAWSGAQPRKAPVRLLWFVGLSTLALTIIVNNRFHFVNNTRHVIALFPVLALIAGIGAARTKLAPLIMGVWALAGIWLVVNPVYINNLWITVLPWDKLATDLRPVAEPGDRLIFLNPDGTPNWINEPSADYYLHDVAIEPDVLDSLPDKTPDEYDQQLRGFVGDAPLFWIAFDPEHRHSVFAQSAVERFVNAGYLACEPSIHTSDVTLQLYAKQTDAPLDYHFGIGSTSAAIALGGLQPFPTTTGSTLRFLLHASVDPAVALGDYSVGVHVENAAGQLVGQSDFGLTQSCYAAEIPGLTPGTYHALLMVYRWQTGERLPATNEITHDQADRLPIGEFTVTG